MNLAPNFNFTSIINMLNNEEVIAYPTEAVYSLGCDPDSVKAVNKLLSLKQRSWKKGLILIASDYQQLIPYINDNALSQKQRDTMFASWSRPITWAIPANADTPQFLTGQFNALAVRVSLHPLVKRLCKKYGKPLVSTSANLNNQEPCRNIDEVKKQFGTTFPVLAGKVGDYLKPSEIKDALSGKKIR